MINMEVKHSNSSDSDDYPPPRTSAGEDEALDVRSSDSSGDVYAETIDYIKQIEKQIVFSLDEDPAHLAALNQHGRITSEDINIYCDILLDKISQDLCITTSLERTTEDLSAAAAEAAPKHSVTLTRGREKDDPNDFLEHEHPNNRFDFINQQGAANCNGKTNGDDDDRSGSKNFDSICASNLPRNSSSSPSHSPHSRLHPHSHSHHQGINDTRNNNISFSLDETSSSPLSANFTRSDDFSKTTDKLTNYRYSFYDNSSKISIYIATASMIDQLQRQHLLSSETFDEMKRDKRIAQSPPPSPPITPTSTSTSAKPFSFFGCHPDQIQLHSRGFIFPPFIEKALVYLSKSGLASVGIFRKSGVKSRITAIRKQCETSGGDSIDFETHCVYDVADFVKSWFRDLAPHLIGKDLIDIFVKKCVNQSSEPEPESKHTEDFGPTLLLSLTDSRRYLLLAAIKFLSLIAAQSKQNQMTAHNLAICFAPSLCECDTEQHIRDAPKCVQYCIENVQSLCYANSIGAQLPANSSSAASSQLNRHTATAIINASPQDILQRLLFERNMIDPLISEWSIKDQSKHGDILDVTIQFSAFLPNKTLRVKRTWICAEKMNSVELDEIADMYRSTWHLGKVRLGQTQVIHELELDLRGFSRRWYETTFATIHNAQLARLTCTFESNLSPDSADTANGGTSSSSDSNSSSDPNPKLLISDV